MIAKIVLAQPGHNLWCQCLNSYWPVQLECHRLQIELNAKQHQLSENDKLLHSLQLELKVYEKLDEAIRSQKGMKQYDLGGRSHYMLPQKFTQGFCFSCSVPTFQLLPRLDAYPLHSEQRRDARYFSLGASALVADVGALFLFDRAADEAGEACPHLLWSCLFCVLLNVADILCYTVPTQQLFCGLVAPGMQDANFY